MKRLAVLILFLIPVVPGCKENDDNDDLKNYLREIAWNDLSEDSRSTVTIDWKQALVEETSYNGIEVYSVSFITENYGILGPIVVYIDKISNEVVGYALRC